MKKTIPGNTEWTDEQNEQYASKQDGIVKELSPELADKIWNSVQKRLYDQRVSKETVLHHLKQLKAQMGKERNIYGDNTRMYDIVSRCMSMVDSKIAKINN